MTTKVIASATVRAVKKRVLPSRAALVLTPTAVQKVKEIMSKEEAKGFIGLKVGVRQRGCNGLSYILDYATSKDKLDEEVKQDGVTIIIDKKAQLTLLGKYLVFCSDVPDSYKSVSADTDIWGQDMGLIFLRNYMLTELTGTEMDFVEDKLSAEFVFNNPNIKGTCGCGESFSI